MMEKTKKKSKVRRYLPFYLMALPGLVYLFINNYMPMGGLILAFKIIVREKESGAAIGLD